jgi:undecaprenyl diphosphate synthase
MPKHVAIIMDGNGRWAAKRGLPRTAGHRQGIEAVRRAVRAAGDMGVRYLTLYSFSTENWSRPKAEITFIMELMRRFIRQDVAELHAAGVRIRIIGERLGLEPSILKMIEDAENLTQNNDTVHLSVAFNYGSRNELARAAHRLAARVMDGSLDIDAVTEQALAAHLDTAELPDPDLLIRTGGDMRISNFLLWQCAYAEFVFVPEFWPDFNAEIFARAVDTFRSRERRFGGLKANTA